MDRKVLSALCALIAGALTTAIWKEFEAALVACAGGQHPIARQEFAKAVNSIAPRTAMVWNICEKMTPKELSDFQAIQYPFEY